MSFQCKNKVIGEGKPLICVPVMETDKINIIHKIKQLSQGDADMIEWRVDAFEEFRDYNQVREILSEVAPCLSQKLFLYTFRTRHQGGESEISIQELEDIHDLAAESGIVDFLDIEFFEEHKPIKKIKKLQKNGMRIIASHHDFAETPKKSVMQMLLQGMESGGADIVKLAVMPRCQEDVLNLLSVTSEFQTEYHQTPIITMAMGEMGVISRICGESFGSCVTFGSEGKASAPGQIPIEKLEIILNILHECRE